MRLGSLAAGIADQLSLAFRNPKKFIDNIDYTLHPKKLADKLLGLELLPPIHVHVEPHDSRQPHLNVLLPTLNPTKLTGGPNTALIIACHLAKMHIPIRVVALDEQVIANVDVLVAHLTSLSGEQIQPNSITFGSTCQADRPVAIGHRDVFLATSWTTAYRLKSVFPRMMTPEFLYLIQDFEPGFYPWSSSYAQALETYSLPFHALINQQGLADYLFQSSVGQFADPAFKDKCIVFEPAIDRTLFFSQKQSDNRRRLLFYARPNQPRNMFGIGFSALRAALDHEVFNRNPWEFMAIGADGAFNHMDLGSGRDLNTVRWRDYQSYASLLREADILLALMLSPHTGYPTLEMAACRGLVVTNTFMNKSGVGLERISPSIIAAEPTIDAIARNLIRAAERLEAEQATERHAPLLPRDWSSALQHLAPKIKQVFIELSGQKHGE